MNGAKGNWSEEYMGYSLIYHRPEGGSKWQYAVIKDGEWLAESGGYVTRKECRDEGLQCANSFVDAEAVQA